MNEDQASVFWTDEDGKEYCDEERALARLLLDGVLFCNERNTAMRPFKTDGKGLVLGLDDTKPWEVSEESTTVLYVLCNDLFYWGTADAESLPNDEIGNLYKMHVDPANKGYGAEKWCCFRRKLRPQVPIVERMKAEGVWDAAMEALPAPEPS